MPFDLAIDLAHALDAVAFAEDRLGFVPDPWQAQLLRSTAHWILLNCSRQSGKSTTTAIVALHSAIYDPGLILLVSPSLRQSKELFSKVMGFLKSLEPVEPLEEDNKSSCEMANGSRVISLPGHPDTLRGYSAPRLIIKDEAALVSDAIGVVITAGAAVTQGRPDLRRPEAYPRQPAPSLLHEGRLKIHRELPEADTLVRELQDFRVEFTATGDLTFNARQGRHDDLVLALAIAAWRAYGPVGPGMGMFEFMRRQAALLTGADEPSKMVVGLDLGQAHDPTAVAVVRRVPTWRIEELPDPPPPPRRPAVATTYAIGSIEWAHEQAERKGAP